MRVSLDMLGDILWSLLLTKICRLCAVCLRFSVHKTEITFFEAGVLITTEYNKAHYGEFVSFEVYLVENRGQVKFSGSADNCFTKEVLPQISSDSTFV